MLRLAAALLAAGITAAGQQEVVRPAASGAAAEIAPAVHPVKTAAMVGRWTAPPKLPPLPSFSDGPITGNGDIGLTWGGPPERIVTYIGHKAFWTGAFFLGGNHVLQRRWGMLLAGTIEWDAPGLKGASYSASQELLTGETHMSFAEMPAASDEATKRRNFSSRTFVGQADTTDDANVFVTEFGVTFKTASGDASDAALPLTLRVFPGNPAVPSASYSPGPSWGGRTSQGVWVARNNTNNTGRVVSPYVPGPGSEPDTFMDTKLTAAFTVSVFSADGGTSLLCTRPLASIPSLHFIASRVVLLHSLTAYVHIRAGPCGIRLISSRWQPHAQPDAAPRPPVRAGVSCGDVRMRPQGRDHGSSTPCRQRGHAAAAGIHEDTGACMVGSVLGEHACHSALQRERHAVLLRVTVRHGQRQARGHGRDRSARAVYDPRQLDLAIHLQQLQSPGPVLRHACRQPSLDVRAAVRSGNGVLATLSAEGGPPAGQHSKPGIRTGRAPTRIVWAIRGDRDAGTFSVF